MSGLREQVQEIGRKRKNREYVAAVAFPELVDALAVQAFVERWPEGDDTAAVRRAAILLHISPGWIPDEEPAARA